MSIDVNVQNDLVIVTESSEDIVVNVSNAAGPQGPAGVGVPVGGTTGQVLKKSSGTNYDTFWSADNAGVPYSGATGDVDLGGNDLKAGSVFVEGATGAGGALRIKQFASSAANLDGYSTISTLNTGVFYFTAATTSPNFKNFVLNPSGLTDNTLRTYTLPNLDGTLALLSDIPSLTGYVPYTGATQDVDLGEFELKAGQVEFDQTPTGTAGVGVMRWNDSDGTVDLGLKGGNVTLQVGQELVQRVVNKSGINLLEANYQVVRVSDAQGQRLAVQLAQGNNDANSTDTIGIVTETINDNQEGFVTTSGLVRNINTTGSLQGETWIDGDVLYLSPTVAGRITKVKPTAPNHSVILGYVVYAHANNGKIFVKVDNGYEIGELHDVYVPTPSNNDGIFWNSTNLRYENKTVAGALGYTPISGSGATGQVAYWNGTSSQTGSNNLFWDAANARLGIGSNIFYTPVATWWGGGSQQQKIFLKSTASSLFTSLVLSGGLSGSGGNAIQFLDYNGAPIGDFGSADGAEIGFAARQNTANINWYTTPSGTTPTKRMSILASGNVIIQAGGTFTDGGQRLQVMGDARVSGASTFARITATTSGIELDYNSGILYHAGGSGSYYQYIDGVSYTFRSRTATGSLIFATQDIERMRIASDGNVGIGNTSPSTFNQRVNAPHLVVGGGSNATGLTLYSGTTNQSSINFAIGTTTTQQYDGGFVYVPNSGSPYLTFHVNGGSERMRITSNGNLGLGVTPSAWGSSTAMQIGTWTNLSSSNAYGSGVGFNTYYNGTNHIYNGSNFASMMQQSSGEFRFYNAPSGTAGNAITFTQAMTLTAAGRLLLGTTTESTFLLDVNGTARVSGNFTVTGVIYTDAVATRSGVSIDFRDQAAASIMYLDATNKRVGIGTTSPNVPLEINGQIRTARINNSLQYLQLEGGDAVGAFITAVGVGKVLTIRNNNTISSDIIFDQAVASSYLFQQATVTKMTLTSGGNLLVGTTTDAGFKLDVNGTARVSGLSRFDSTAVFTSIASFATTNGLNLGYSGGIGYIRAVGGTTVEIGGSGSTVTTSNGTLISGLFTANGKATFSGSCVINGGLSGDSGINIGSISNLGYINNYATGGHIVINSNGGNLLVGTTTNDNSALLNLSSTTKGFLPPRMTTTQKNAIGTPAAGLQVYDTTLNQMSYYNGTTWINF